MFQPSTTLSFTASSPAGVTNVTVKLTVSSLYTGQSFVRNLSSANGGGLTVSGPATGESVSVGLSSNTLYSAIITVQDATGNSANQTVTFDTISPVYTWEAEDWDYTSNAVSGLFIDNPQTNGYAGLDTTAGIDAQNGNGNASTYRPGNTENGHGGLYTETTGSPESNYKRLQYINTGKTDYDVGFTDTGDFGNYTRHYPAGTYNLFVRAAGGNGAKANSANIAVQSGNAFVTSPAVGPYKFGVKGNGWQNYDFMPVTDSAGNLIQITFDGTQSTLNVLQAADASDNMNFFMLMPINTNIAVSTVTVTNITPDGSALFNQAGTFSFNAFSPGAPVNPNNITVTVTATNLWLNGSVTDLTSGNGLTITGDPTNLNVSFSTTSNTIYSVYIQIIDMNGTPSSATASFDTIIPTYTWEAEDFNYGGGGYVDNPQTNAYNGLDGAADVDFHVDTQHGGDYNRVGLTTESLSEKLRPQYNGTGKQDYDVGFNNGGNWGNYTRTYPAGTYNIWVRVSNGTGNTSADSGSISLVTTPAPVNSTSQTVVKLGTFSVPAIAWSTYSWVPVKDPAGNLVQFTGGSVETLRMTIDGGNCNENFFLLTPANPASVLQPFVDSFTPDGSALFQPSNTVSFIVHSQPGATTNNIVLNLNGVNVSGMTFGGTPNIRNVSYPIQPNAFYTAIVTVTDANGTVRLTNSFGTFVSTNFQWEAEDYDYGGGQKFENPQVGSYNGLGSVAGIDNNQADLNANPFNYRLNAAPNYAPSTTPSGDAARDQFAGATDYNIGFFGRNSWANYTRQYPAGTYNVIGRFAEGNSATEDTLSIVTSGVGTANQTTNFLGTFPIPAKGWGTWEWSTLTDGNGKPVKITLDGTETTLQLEGTPIDGHDEANVNFFMLVPVAPSPILTSTINGGNIQISFPTQNGYSYQLLYKNNLADANWTSVGALVTGDGSVHSVNDSRAGQGSRFYRVQVQ